MKRWVLFLLVVLGVLGHLTLRGSLAEVTPDRPAVPVLLYHDLALVPPADPNGATISVAEFEWQMAYLHDQGFHTITTHELQDWLSGHGKLPDRPVLITFDDGYRSFSKLAYPVLARLDMRATIFVVGSTVGRTIDLREHLTWSDLRSLAESGRVEVQSHTYAGHAGKSGIAAWTPAQIAADGARLKEAMRVNGLPIATALAFPYGLASSDPATTVSESYELAFTASRGQVTVGQDQWRLPRQSVFPGINLPTFVRLLYER